MKIISWNVAGLRACIKKGLIEFMEKENADIYCFQETKVLSSQIPLNFNMNKQYYEYLFPAKRKGYSGTAVYTKIKPLNVFYGIDNDINNENLINNSEITDKSADYTEGRVITLDFSNFYLVTCYVPNSKPNLERLKYRLEFEDKMLSYLVNLKQKKPVIYCGDLNVAFTHIDVHNPDPNSPCYTPEERSKFATLLQNGFVDIYRHLNPSTVKYTYWNYIGYLRRKNIGWRIDYFIIDKKLVKKVKTMDILDDIVASDHCPIRLIINI